MYTESRRWSAYSLDFRQNHIYNYDKRKKVLEIVPSIDKSSAENALWKQSKDGTIQRYIKDESTFSQERTNTV